LISGFVGAYLELNKEELVVFKKEIGKLAKEEEVLEITNSWKEEGIIEGLREGKVEGLREGEIIGLREGLEPALRLRFGDEGRAFLANLPEAVDVDTLKRIADQVLVAADLATLRRLVS
jgi:hypothetical protein